ncbi:hypothetical protein CJ030_MR3G009396 [Morella rubra]|uniref:NmrA-like domain-containing protein n=1 Tax=Morella rubra TaxID=262757 RepID=A0A6A1W5W6_9ROSI|nr:hypothetical protein CJ030_MR3G009396 [Morella rubra]
MAAKSRILIIGCTVYVGKFIVEASAKAGHPTFALVRKSTLSNPTKGKLFENFKNLGVVFLHGDLYDHESMVKAIKQVDMVISTVGPQQLADQVKIIATIKEAGSVKGCALAVAVAIMPPTATATATTNDGDEYVTTGTGTGGNI